jgi:riboflavin synthase
MFTGIVAETGEVKAVSETDEGIRLELAAEKTLQHANIGDSIAVNGCCLTVVELDAPENGAKGRVRLDLLRETWNVTNLHAVKPGCKVNLERPLAFNGSLDGHFVTGHVDGVGKIVKWEQQGADWLLEIEPPADLIHLLVYKGSVALDGISLTVAKVLENRFQIWIIPHTYQVTNLHTRSEGELINIETDLLGKYVERFIEARNHSGPSA